MDVQTMQRLTQGMKNINSAPKNGSGPDNDAEVLNFLGTQFYEKGDYGRAFGFFQQAAQNGSVLGMFNLGKCYYNGEGTEENPALAFAWSKKAAENGDSLGMYLTANMYINGEGVTENFEAGLKWLRDSAEAGNTDAMAQLGAILEKSDDLDLKKLAVCYYLEAAEAGNLTAINNLGCVFYNGIAGALPADKSQAKDFFELASKQDHVPSMINLAELLNENGDTDGYRYWYRKAAENGSHDAQEVVESWKQEDDGCFITTAVCGSFGKPDNCYELSAFRNFRDGWLAAQADGKNLIAQYYSIAPKIVATINRRDNASEIYQYIWREYLKPCLSFIESGDNFRCKKIYIRMVRELQEEFLP